MSLAFFFALVYGYSLGLQHNHSAFLNLLPNLTITLDEEKTEIIEKTFFIKSNLNEKSVSIANTISFPHSWYFSEEENSDNKNMINAKRHIISSPNEEVNVIITPIKINDLSSVMSATTTIFSQEIESQCLTSYDIPKSEEFESLEFHRKVDNQNNIKYFQKVNSGINSYEELLVISMKKK